MDPSMEFHQHQESMLVCTNEEQHQQEEKKAIKAVEEALKCPRCESTNTKFCYYNNYSLTQPRYFCKSCRRYWTKGGTLRNVPVGGGCRKNKRSTLSKRNQDQPISISSPNPNSSFSYDSHISLAIARLQQKQNVVGQMGYNNIFDNPGLFDVLRGGEFGTTTNYQNLYYGHLENGGLSLGINGVDEMGSSLLCDQEIGSGFSTETTTVASVKQEMSNNPWQFGGEGNTVDKQNWYNGFGSSSWHALLNNPLM